ncbi:unnamed protein product [Oppiella nova]|uniref:CUB domain-containing protein n=1 Tax=Oppiella nova TaxID=334625 RepID=A0A7R9M572_9ACAR|nr:unnamed protein product [Oppiella nova]CAG2170963.1 unnamed protein product [Oppiella nova]
MCWVIITQSVRLGGNDLLRVTTHNTRTLLYEHFGQLSPGVILITTRHKVVRVVLTLSPDRDVDREWDVGYNTKDLSAQFTRIDSAGSFVFPYYHKEMDFKGNGLDFNLLFEAKSDTKKLLINVADSDLNGGTVSFRFVEKYSSLNLFDANHTKPEFLLSKGQQIVVMIRGFRKYDTNPGNALRLDYEVVDSRCSQYKQRFLLDLTHFSQFINTGDIMRVLDDISRDSQPMAVIESQLLDTYWRHKYLYSTANRLRVSYESQHVVNTSGNYRFNDTAFHVELELNTKTKTLLPIVYTFEATSGYQLVVDLDDIHRLPGNGSQNLLAIYESTDRHSEQPIIELQSQAYPPRTIASNTNQLKLVFNQWVDYKLTVRKVKANGCYARAGTSYTRYHNTTCEPKCSWLIPGRPNTSGTFILHFTHISLPNSTDRLTLRMVGRDVKAILEFTGPFHTTSIPDVILPSNETHVLYTEHECLNQSSPLTITSLYTVSMTYWERDVSNTELIFTNYYHSLEFQTYNHPMDYPYGMDYLWKVYSTYFGINYTLATFSDISLRYNHSLNIKSLINSNTFGYNSLPPDTIFSLPMIANLTASYKTTWDDQVTFGGFRAILYPLECGGNFNMTYDSRIQVTTPDTLTNVTRCVWIINTGTGYEDSVLKLKFADYWRKDYITIYDSNTMRNGRLLDVRKGTVRSTTNTIIIDYSVRACSFCYSLWPLTINVYRKGVLYVANITTGNT